LVSDRVRLLEWFSNFLCSLYYPSGPIFSHSVAPNFGMDGSFWTVSLCIYVLVHTWSVFVLPHESCTYIYLGVVNVLLLYNTFYVLGPAFNDQRSSMTQRANESFGTPELFRRSTARWVSSNQKSDPYSRQPPSPSSQFVKQANSSDRALLLAQPEQATSVQSFYSYTPSPAIDDVITPPADVFRTMAFFESANYSPHAQVFNHYDRQGSTDVSGLPAAPRRTRSPILRLPSKSSPLRTVNDIRSPVHPHLSKHNTNVTFGSAGSPNSAPSVGLSPSGDQRFRQYYPHENTRPMFSAMNPMSPSPISPPLYPALPRHARSLSTVPMPGPDTVGRHRTVLADSNGSVDNASELAYSGIRRS
jgi:hypothetical protein